ncbi:histone protein [Streptomyces sp. NPDC051840]|uniref:histone protein n=1 Tax=Streptomyces sp. NPDC051840 TaxID=3154752 RepID=UPI003419045A
MDEKTKAALASGLAGGYVLGRTKKGKLALSVAMFLAGRNISLEPKQLAAQAVRRLGQVPQVAGVQKQIRGEGLDAARGAVTAVASHGVGSLADAIGKRALDLRSEGDASGDEDEDADEGDAPADDAEADVGEAEDDEEAPAARRGRRGPAKESSKSAGGRKAPPAKKAASAKKKASQAPARKTAARRTASKRTADESSSAGKASRNTSSRSSGRR